MVAIHEPVAMQQDPSLGSGSSNSAFNRFAIGGLFAFLIMQAILSMSQSQMNKTSLDSSLSETLANADSTYMTSEAETLQTYYTTYIQGNTNTTNIANTTNASGATTDCGGLALSVAEGQYGEMQTEAQGVEQQMKSVASSATNTVSSDNTNMSDFYQFATTAVQLLGYAAQMLQHSMG
ncbi:MAG: hypothetical protein HY860_06055 [Chlamydiales bacterium]|nr:hypothetical protein [Chlamydiales bacterium]